jgi:hypothetical protein
MKTRRAHTAHVTLTVARPGDFKPIPGGYTKCKVALSEKTGRIKLGPGGLHKVHESRRGPVIFKVAISPKGTYVPAGVAFEHTGGRKGSKKLKPRHVRANFPAGKVGLGGGVLTFVDECKSNATGSSFEYYVLIQRKDGALGVIDPGIQHDPTN